MAAYYNEIEPFAAQWLRNLIAAGHIADGVVDERSIRDVAPADVAGFTQAHFFAGIGVWSHALRSAGWDDSRPVWTGSCPCQPFSAAGRGRGTADERHLWPEFHRLIAECRPPVVLGEQVASALGRDWLDAVRIDLEAVGYAVGAADLGAASVGAPHIRQRLWWVADAEVSGRGQGGKDAGRLSSGDCSQRSVGRSAVDGSVDGGGLADADADRRSAVPQRRFHDAEHNAEPCRNTVGLAQPAGARPQGGDGSWERADAQRSAAERGGAVGGVEYAAGCGRGQDGLHAGGGGAAGGEERLLERGDAGQAGDASPLHGFWRDADWLLCRDGKWRPVEPGTFPLAHGATSRVGRLRAYGNAIVAPLAAEFIAAVMDCQP